MKTTTEKRKDENYHPNKTKGRKVRKIVLIEQYKTEVGVSSKRFAQVRGKKRTTGAEGKREERTAAVHADVEQHENTNTKTRKLKIESRNRQKVARSKTTESKKRKY